MARRRDELAAHRRVERPALDGEIATLAVLPATLAIERAALSQAFASAHMAFYDAEYFETKKRGQIARKYRDEVRGAETTDDVRATIIDAGPRLVERSGPARAHRASGPTMISCVDRTVVRNAVAFEATFDGLTVTVEPERDQLERYAREVRAAWEPFLAGAHHGALLYLTRYFTPHPPGEPH